MNSHHKEDLEMEQTLEGAVPWSIDLQCVRYMCERLTEPAVDSSTGVLMCVECGSFGSTV